MRHSTQTTSTQKTMLDERSVKGFSLGPRRYNVFKNVERSDFRRLSRRTGLRSFSLSVCTVILNGFEVCWLVGGVGQLSTRPWALGHQDLFAQAQDTLVDLILTKHEHSIPLLLRSPCCFGLRVEDSVQVQVFAKSQFSVVTLTISPSSPLRSCVI